jgi:hypothetical protein
MSILIEILCPSRKCRKCKRMISTVKRALDEEKIDAEILILDRLEYYVRYETWVLPSLFVNGRPVARGYTPSNNKLVEILQIESGKEKVTKN